MSSWAERAATTILPLSRATSLALALAEWHYTGRFFDHEEASETCELCGQEDLRYHFEIANRGTDSVLMVGSECIKRFELGGIDEQGRSIGAEDTARLVDRHRRNLVEDARKRRVVTSLLKLGRAQNDFDALSFIDYLDDRGGFTPKQLAMLFWHYDRTAVEYRPGDYRLRMRRNRELAQLRTMSAAAYRRVQNAMTKAQRDRIERIKANFAEYDQIWR